MLLRLTLLQLGLLLSLCTGAQSRRFVTDREVTVGAARFDQYLEHIRKKKIALVANPTSRIGTTHLVDTLLSLGVRIGCIFAPEHGYRGEAAAGEHVKGGKDRASGIPVISLYGKHTRPREEDLRGIDVVLYDIQDVGARFYTYSSTLQQVMEACADYGKPLIILDRPNPNGHYVDGPVLDTAFRSFVGLVPVPVVHGCTMGEYARMLQGEGWLRTRKQCKLTVIPVAGYRHSDLYRLPIAPSPNLPNMTAVYLYPSLCFFEGTPVSIGRGTDAPFQVVGYPGYKDSDFRFKPKSIPGKAMHPPFEDSLCTGLDLRKTFDSAEAVPARLDLRYLIRFFKSWTYSRPFFNPFFDKLAGSESLRQLIFSGWEEDAIRKTWAADLEHYRAIRKQYLLYPD
jgi:uncharacterized protein YbbC (DUF1343 family)